MTPSSAVHNLYHQCGITDPQDLPIDVIIKSRNICIKEEKIDGAEGRIVMNENSGIITINANIDFPAKKRFVLAHELGHFELHRHHRKVFDETDETLNHWYTRNCKPEETEANEFAAEFLMPSHLFASECKGKKFDHKVIEHLANCFQVSKTAAILKFAKESNGNHPIFIVCCQNNKMKWFKRSDDFYYYSLFQHDFPPPYGSVAYEVFNEHKLWQGDDKTQPIWKSDWFEMKRHDEKNTPFFEYCLYVKAYNYTLSVIWER